MAEGFNNVSDVVEVNDTKGIANIYYTLAMEKIRDVSANSSFVFCLLLFIFNVVLEMIS